MKKNLHFVLLAALFVVTPACKDDSNCTLNIQMGRTFPSNHIIPLVSGGEKPYSYLWSSGSTSISTPFDSTIAIYSVTVTDFNGCTEVGIYDLNACPVFFPGYFYSPVNINGRCWVNANVLYTLAIPQVTNP